MTLLEIAAFLRTRSSLFANFSDLQLKDIVEGSRLTAFVPNEAIIEFGEEGRFLGVLLDGEAEASVTDDSGEKRRLGLVRPGDLFGEVSLMTGDRTMADIIGVTHCTALLIPYHLFATLIITNPSAVKHLSRLISERLRAGSESKAAAVLTASAFRRSEDPYGFKLKSDAPMKLLVVNCGSSSLKYNLFDTADESKNARGLIERIGEGGGMKLAQRSARGPLSRDLP